MIFIGTIQLVIWELIIPAMIGSVVLGKEKGLNGICLSLTAGQIIMWAVFQPIAVIFILRNEAFSSLVAAYAFLTAAMLICAVIAGIKSNTFRLRRIRLFEDRETDRMTAVLFLLSMLLLALQVFMAVFLAYADGDDAYYIATSTVTNDADTMYMKLPYTGGSTELDVRHGLAPFPIWVSFLSRISGIHTAIVAHVAVSAVMIIMSYGVLFLLGSSILKKKQLPVFMLAAELLILFGDYSYYSVENFMLARSRQGKAALGSVIIPFIIYLLYRLLERLRLSEKAGIKEWLLLAASVTAGCLCTTMGTLLVCLLMGITGIFGASMYRNFRFITFIAVCCLPAVIFAGMYALIV